jgi:Domain of unknown function (DUF5666)
MTNPFKHRFASVGLAVILAGCGGGGGGGIDGTGTGTPSTGSGGTSSTGVAFGTVTGYGSVIVNGVRYEDNGVLITKTDGSTVRGDGAGNISRSALPIGSVVRVDFNSVTSVAGFKVDDSVSGRIESIVPGIGINVMGQTIRIDDTTSQYEDNVLRLGGVAWLVGDFVQVQGAVVAPSTIQSSFVNKLSASGTLFEVKGFVTNHIGTNSFNVGSLNISYSTTTTLSDMPSGSWNGLIVEVKGTNCTLVSGICNTLMATKIEPEGGLQNNLIRSNAQIEGIALSGTSASFKIGNTTVNTSSSTQWEGGTQADFALGVKLEAEGSLNNNILNATKISLRDGSRLEGNVSAPLLTNGILSFKLAGLPTVTIKANNNTSLNGTTLTGLTAGQHVRLRGRVANDGSTVVATELESRSSSSRLELRGVVNSVAGTTVTILNTPVNVNGLSFSDSRGANSIPINQSTFLSAIRIGSTVKLRSNNNGLTWSEAELESD